MQVKDIMSSKIESVSPDAPIQQIARCMRDEDIGAVPVTDEGRVVGVVTDRDLVLRCLAEDGADLSGLTADQVMSRNVISCYEDQSLEEAAANMQAATVRRLAVTDRDERLVGMVSIGDLATQEPQRAGSALDTIASAA